MAIGYKVMSGGVLLSLGTPVTLTLSFWSKAPFLLLALHPSFPPWYWSLFIYIIYTFLVHRRRHLGGGSSPVWWVGLYVKPSVQFEKTLTKVSLHPFQRWIIWFYLIYIWALNLDAIWSVKRVRRRKPYIGALDDDANPISAIWFHSLFRLWHSCEKM
jgi:hypothetical protein